MSATWRGLGNHLKTTSSLEMATQALKAALRKDMKATLSALSEDDVASQTKAVVQKLLCNETFRNSTRISVYLSTKGEIGTTDIIRHLFDNGKQCFVPKYQVGGEIMDMVPLYSMQDFDSLPLTKWNIKQPAADDLRPDVLETGGLDIILAPGVAFTQSGARLGHGRGYYDAYLRRCFAKADIPKPFYIGLALKEQIVNSVPMSQTDIPVDLVISP